VDAEPQPPTTAEALFAEFLDRTEAGEEVDFERLCRDHPAQAPALRRVHERWQAMSRAFTQLSRETGGAASAPSKSVDDLKQRLGAPGGRLARYVLREELARGAMGRIVRAWDEELRREVALKVQAGPGGDTRLQRRFLEEAQITAQLDHPGIVPVHELGLLANGRPFFAMQLVRGRDLGQILAAVRDGRDGWTRTRVLGVLLRVCEAMAFAHDRGVVHRDLKPGNVMVGRFGEAFVMDWGLAHAAAATPVADAEPVATLRGEIAHEDGDSPLLTRDGDVVGTPAYMAPEQAAGGDAAQRPAVDVYALGAILYHLLCGAMPYAATTRTADDVLAALRAGPPAPLRDDVPPELRAICERAMARAPGDRYASMAELADDVRAFLEVRTVRAYATGPFAELHKWVARNRLLAGVAAAFAAALVVGAIAMTTLWVRAEGDRVRADATARSLQVELERSAFQRARQTLQLDNSTQAAAALWRSHLRGSMPRATAWALKELAERDPYLAAVPERTNGPVAFSSAGDAVLFSALDGRLQVRDADTLALTALVGEPGPRLAHLLALDGSTVVGGDSQGQLAVFDLRSGEVTRRPAHIGAVSALIPSAASEFLSGGADGRVLRWPSGDGDSIELLHGKHAISALALGPGTDEVLVGDDHGGVVVLGLDGVVRRPRFDVADAITAIATPGPGQFLVGTRSHGVRRVDFADASRDWTKWSRNGAPRALLPQSDGTFLLAGWWRIDRVTENGDTFTPLALRPTYRVATDHGRRRLATTSSQSGLGLLELQPTWRREIPGAGASGLSGDGRLLAVSRGNRATVIDVATGNVAHDLPVGSNGWVTLSGDGRTMAASQLSEGRLVVWDVATGTRRFESAGPTTGSGFATRFSPDDSELVVAVEGNLLRRLRTADGSTVAEHRGPRGVVQAIAWSGDGRWLAALPNRGSHVRVFDLTDGNHRDEPLTSHWPPPTSTALSAVALSHDGGRLAVGNANGPILVRGRDGSTQVLAGHEGTVWSLQFPGNDAGLLVSAGGASGISCWDLDSGECCYQAIRDQSSQVELSRDGMTMSCITPGGAVVLDLGYHERHIAGNLPMHLEGAAAIAGVPVERARALRTWAADVLARPWPRWQR